MTTTRYDAFVKRMKDNPQDYFGKAEYCGVSVSKRQLALLECIHKHFDENGFYPSLREIGAEMGVSSTNALANHIKGLVQKGLLESRAGKSRSLVLTKFRPVLVPVDRYDDFKSSLSHKAESA